MIDKIRYLTLSLAVFAIGCGGGGGAPSCGGTSGNFCPEGQYCKVEIGLCGGEGECTDIPLACDAAPPSVCSCEGISFFNECWAAQAGQGVQALGDCINN